MTHFFYRNRRELPLKSPLLPLIRAEQSKREKYETMLKSGVPPHTVFGFTKPSKVVKLPHELEEGYKEYHERSLYKRLFRNHEEQHEENKSFDELSKLPELHFRSRMLRNADSKNQKGNDDASTAAFDRSQESMQVFIGKPGFEDIALLINAEYNIKKASLLEGKNICCYESLLMFLMRDSNICYACTRRKKMKFLLCQTCFGIHEGVPNPHVLPHPRRHHYTFQEGRTSLIEFLRLNVFRADDQNPLPDNCGCHHEYENPTVIINNTEKYRLNPRNGITNAPISSLQYALAVQQGEEEQLMKAIAAKLELKKSPNNVYDPVRSTTIEKLFKQASQILTVVFESDLRVQQEIRIKLWLSVIAVSSRQSLLKSKCPSVVRKENFMKRSLGKIRKARESRAFLSWIICIETIKENRRKVQSSIAKILNRKLAAAYNSWHTYTVRNLAVKRFIQRRLAKEYGSAEMKYFHLWLDFTHESLDNKEEKIAKFLLTWRMAPAAACLKKWREHTDLMKRVRNFARKLKYRQAHVAWNSWVDMVDNVHKIRDFMKRMFAKNLGRLEQRMFFNWVDFVDDCLIEKERKIKMVLMKIFHRKEMEVLERLKEIRIRGKASKQMQRMCRGHLARLALAQKRAAANIIENQRRAAVEKKAAELISRVDIKLQTIIDSAIRSKMSELMRVLKGHYKKKEREKKEAEEKEKQNIEEEIKKKREEADKTEAEENQGRGRGRTSGYGYSAATFTSQPVEIIEEKKKQKKKEDKEMVLIKETWQRYDPLGTLTIFLNDIPEVLKRLGIAVDVTKVKLPATEKDGKVTFKQFLRWLKTDALMHLSKLTFLNRIFRHAKEIGSFNEMEDLYRALHEGLRFYISNFVKWEYDYDSPRYLTFHCFLCTKKFHSFDAWRKHKKAPCLGRVLENRRIQNECITYKLVQPLLVPHDIDVRAAKSKGKLTHSAPTFNIFHEYLQDEIDYKKVNLWYNMEIRMKGDRFLHRKFRRREREERRYRRRLARDKRKYEFQQYTKKKRAEQAANANIQREIRIKQAIEKEREEEENRLRKLLMVEEEDAGTKKKKRKKKKRKKRKKKEKKNGEEGSDDDIELDVDFL